MNLYYQPLVREGANYLDPDESRHCVKVLRNQSGDQIHITDGKGFMYDAVITKADPGKCSFTVSKKISVPPRKFSIHVAISPVKNADRMEWFVEKVVEIGIEKISFIECEHTERSFVKTDRLEKIAISAMKQSLKAWLPSISRPVRLSDFVKSKNDDAKYIAHVDQTNTDHLMKISMPGTDCLVLIGPEGDFSAEELNICLAKGYRKASLGGSRLRTETAGVVACHILNLINS